MSEKVAPTRRAFLIGCAAVGASMAVAAPMGSSVAAAQEDVDGAEGHYGFLVDMGKCVGCKNCVRACRKGNNLTEDTPDRRRVDVFKNSKKEKVYVSTSCMHCDDPNCLRVCPAGAISKDAVGAVVVDKDKCIGCKYCFAACPYGVPKYNEEAMDKCDCCRGAGIAPGDEPYCAQACIFGALQYGTVDELMAAASKRNISPVRIGDQCGPNCYLIGEVG